MLCLDLPFVHSILLSLVHFWLIPVLIPCILLWSFGIVAHLRLVFVTFSLINVDLFCSAHQYGLPCLFSKSSFFREVEFLLNWS